MAKKKKKEDALTYLQMPLTEGVKYSKMTKVAFGGLNNRYTHDSGELSMESNISTKEYPYLTPSEKRVAKFGTEENPYQQDGGLKEPISMFAFDNFLIVVYYEKVGDSDYIKLDYITEGGTVHTGIIRQATDENPITEEDKKQPRSIVQFNVYDTPTDPLTGQYVKKLLIFPDCVSMFMNIEVITDDWLRTKGYANLEKYMLSDADLNTMYRHNDGFYTASLVKKNQGDEGYDANKVSYKRVYTSNSTIPNSEETLANIFFCDSMNVTTKKYTPANDADPPPESASHNCYYKNTKNNMTYRWVEDENDSSKSAWKICIAPAMPKLKYATVHSSRVFGVDDDRVYASGFNSYGNWNLDAVDEYNESNAWCSPSQSNTKAGGKFTGITTFQNHVICFKSDFMHEIYNTKNPFRIQDIYAEGAIDNRTIQDVDGRLIFVSEDDVKIYTGSNPRIIGYNLNMPRYEYAVSGTDNRNYYLYCEESSGKSHLYVYDTFTEMWSEEEPEEKTRVLSFSHNKNGMYMLCDNGVIYQMDTGDYLEHKWSFETDLITNKTVDIKHIKKLQMLVDVDDDAPADEPNLQVYVLYDDDNFETMSDEGKAKRLVFSSNKSGKFPIRVKPRKTASYGFKLHFEGVGYVKLYELEIFVEQGGGLYV